MNKTIAAAAAALALLAGCASTPGGMRADLEAKRVQVVPMGYQLALKRLVDHHAECSAAPVLPLGQMINDVQHYPDLRTASIVRGASGMGTQIVEVVDLREPEPGRTEITTWSKKDRDELAARTLRVVQGSTSCRG
jgi:hypothetical protein